MTTSIIALNKWDCSKLNHCVHLGSHSFWASKVTSSLRNIWCKLIFWFRSSAAGETLILWGKMYNFRRASISNFHLTLAIKSFLSLLKKKKGKKQQNDQLKTARAKKGRLRPIRAHTGWSRRGHGEVAGPLPFWPPAPLPHRPQLQHTLLSCQTFA